MEVIERATEQAEELEISQQEAIVLEVIDESRKGMSNDIKAELGKIDLSFVGEISDAENSFFFCIS